MFLLCPASSTVCLHKPILCGLRKGFLSSSGCDGTTLVLGRQADAVFEPHVFFPVMWQEGDIQNK